MKKHSQRHSKQQSEPKTPTRARILQRDWMHAATDDVNREIVRLRAMQHNAEEDVTRDRAKANERQKVAVLAKADADALETLVEGRK